MSSKMEPKREGKPWLKTTGSRRPMLAKSKGNGSVLSLSAPLTWQKELTKAFKSLNHLLKKVSMSPKRRPG